MSPSLIAAYGMLRDGCSSTYVRFPESATVPVHAPRHISRKVRTRYKYSPIASELYRRCHNAGAESQGLPNDDTKSEQYKFSTHLHVCGGAIRGRRLCVPPVYLRPMMSRVKNAVFAALQHMGVFAYGHDCK
ncbi:N6-adenine-specific methylase, putative [Babesia caballi]|uniref:N6-adenine-specific methylase, putative n=1 Tax=Babesia caballi TaxID=5871 RepID=A0AAV4M299_BABCB|nr:N6-adenine-specific methylase, putative [Babesia caballi]